MKYRKNSVVIRENFPYVFKFKTRYSLKKFISSLEEAEEDFIFDVDGSFVALSASGATLQLALASKEPIEAEKNYSLEMEFPSKKTAKVAHALLRITHPSELIDDTIITSATEADVRCMLKKLKLTSVWILLKETIGVTNAKQATPFVD